MALPEGEDGMADKTPFKKDIAPEVMVKNLDEIFREIQTDFHYGLTVKDVALGVTEVSIPHRLGEIPNGWLIIDKNANEDIWSSTAKDGRFLYLTASGNVTVTIFIW